MIQHPGFVASPKVAEACTVLSVMRVIMDGRKFLYQTMLANFKQYIKNFSLAGIIWYCNTSSMIANMIPASPWYCHNVILIVSNPQVEQHCYFNQFIMINDNDNIKSAKYLCELKTGKTYRGIGK